MNILRSLFYASLYDSQAVPQLHGETPSMRSSVN